MKGRGQLGVGLVQELQILDRYLIENQVKQWVTGGKEGGRIKELLVFKGTNL